ncbi:MAG: YecA family protein [Rubrivivax sp.]|nr:YecA family protein [Rubrivivax sp.]
MASPDLPPLADSDIEALQRRLDALPAPLEPLDTSALDGFLCGVVLQPRALPVDLWLRYATDVEGRPLPGGVDARPLHALVRRRHAEIARAVARRDWFDPWIYALDGDATPSESVAPWVAGFALAMERFPALLELDDEALIEPLALLYLHLDPDDLQDADAIAAVIASLEPPADLAEAVQDVVQAVMLIADVAAPRAPSRTPPRHAASRRRR